MGDYRENERVLGILLRVPIQFVVGGVLYLGHKKKSGYIYLEMKIQKQLHFVET